MLCTRHISRAAEMREVMDTLNDAGVEHIMSEVTARAQDALVDAMRAKELVYPSGDFDWPAWLVTVSGNWRVTFVFLGQDADIVDYQDYH